MKILLKICTVSYLLFLLLQCSQLVHPDFQSDAFSDKALLSRLHLKAEIQLQNPNASSLSDTNLPIDVRSEPISSDRIIIRVPMDPTDASKITDITNLKPVIEGEYFYITATIAGELKKIGIDAIDTTNPVTLRVFAENNSFQEYTLSVQQEEFPPTPPQAFRVRINNNDARAFGTLNASYIFGDANYDPEGTSRFRWLRAKSQSGEYQPIAGAEGMSYEMTQEDAGYFIRFEVTPVSMNLSKEAGSPALSAPIGPVRAVSELELRQHNLKIVEIGNKYEDLTANDYVILYNPSSEFVNLGNLYIGRDSGCSISTGTWSVYKALSGVISANGYFLISRSGNTLNADSTVFESVSMNDCVVLTNSSTRPRSATDSNVIDFVGFGSSPVSEGTPALALPSQYILRRENSCSDNPQNTQDTDNNVNDFDLIDASSSTFRDDYNVRNTQNSSCAGGMTTAMPPTTMPPTTMPPTTMPPAPTPMPTSSSPSTTLVIAEVGNKINNVTANDYVVLYNKTGSEINLSGYYLGRDSGCSISTGSWTGYEALSGMIPANGYFLIARSGNTLNADSTSFGGVTSNYCVALTNSSTRPRSAADSQVVDFVGFGSSPVSEGGEVADTLSDRAYIRRGGTCSDTDTNHNENDFTRTTGVSSGYSPKNSSSPACTP